MKVDDDDDDDAGSCLLALLQEWIQLCGSWYMIIHVFRRLGMACYCI